MTIALSDDEANRPVISITGVPVPCPSCSFRKFIAGSGQELINFFIAPHRLFVPYGLPNVRPNEKSTAFDIQRYLRYAKSFCATATTILRNSEYYSCDEIIKIAPVDGCFKDIPPHPHVTKSEVVAVIINSAAADRWRNSGTLESHRQIIVDTIQDISKIGRPNDNFRTYVLGYTSTISDHAPRKNHLLFIDFDDMAVTPDESAEEKERDLLVRDLTNIFGYKAVEEAIHKTYNQYPSTYHSSLMNKITADTSEIRNAAINTILMGFGSIFVSIFSLLFFILISYYEGFFASYKQAFLLFLSALSIMFTMKSGSRAEFLIEIADGRSSNTTRRHSIQKAVL